MCQFVYMYLCTVYRGVCTVIATINMWILHVLSTRGHFNITNNFKQVALLLRNNQVETLVTLVARMEASLSNIVMLAVKFSSLNTMKISSHSSEITQVFHF